MVKSFHVFCIVNFWLIGLRSGFVVRVILTVILSGRLLLVVFLFLWWRILVQLPLYRILSSLRGYIWHVPGVVMGWVCGVPRHCFWWIVISSHWLLRRWCSVCITTWWCLWIGLLCHIFSSFATNVLYRI